MIQVESEAIAEIDYKTASSTLLVRFAHGDWYRYFMVPPKVYAAFLAAESHGRSGAVQLDVRLRNDGARPVSVVDDPWLAEVVARGASGEIRCTPSGPRIAGARARELAPGASLPLRIDLSARCEVGEPGTYEVEIAFPAVDAPAPRASTRVEVAPRTWVNPGPRGG